MKYQIAEVLRRLVDLILAIATILLGLRFLLKLFSANASNSFVDWIYATSGEILGPFRGIFPSANLDGFVIEFSTLFALMIYGIIGMLAYYVIDLLTPEEPKRVK